MNGNGNGRKKRRKRIIIGSVIVVVIVLIVGVAVAFSHGTTKIDPSKLAKVEKGDLAKGVVATGKVEPITKVEVKSKASGIVKKLHVEYGDKVKKGQLLAQLDKRRDCRPGGAGTSWASRCTGQFDERRSRLRARQSGC